MAHGCHAAPHRTTTVPGQSAIEDERERLDNMLQGVMDSSATQRDELSLIVRYRFQGALALKSVVAFCFGVPLGTRPSTNHVGVGGCPRDLGYSVCIPHFKQSTVLVRQLIDAAMRGVACVSPLSRVM